ncbi:MAG: 50S ribosomal protein L15 [Chloroflexi bacterium]|nr:50S ribosomal protein L15 [Chloroflexota bacterium]
MRMHELKPAPGAKRKRTRVGRGHGSGLVKTAGKGTKGQKARSGRGINPRFEGGQLPLIQRLPHKRGFTNIFRIEFQELNLGRLAIFPPDAAVGPAEMARAGLIKSANKPVKVLGHGAIDRALRVSAHAFSESAEAKIKAAGGAAAKLGEKPEKEAASEEAGSGS